MPSDHKSSKATEDKENSAQSTRDAEGEVASVKPVEDTESGDEATSEVTDGDSRFSGGEGAADESGSDDGAVLIEGGTADDNILAEAETIVDAEGAALDVVAPTEAPARPTQSGPSAFGLVFGGLVAGAIGFLVATFAVPDGWPNPRVDSNATYEAALDAQAVRIEGLVAQIENLRSASEVEIPDLSPVTEEIAGLAARVDGLSGDVAASAERLAALESRPAGEAIVAPTVDFDAEMGAFRAELEAAAASARAEVEAAQARAAEVEAQAAAAADVAMKRAALAEMSAALEGGAPFADVLARVPGAPDALVAVAEQGVPTLAALRAEFPAAAREALRGAQSVPADASATDRLAAFLRKQTNARSLSPREGDDPDAVLSRAEAALNGGDLSLALSELSALPDGAVAALSDWIASAETRATAIGAVQALTNDLN